MSSVSSVQPSSVKLVNCGVCMSVPESSCRWCSGTGGAAPVTAVVSSAAGQVFPVMLLSAVLCFA